MIKPNPNSDFDQKQLSLLQDYAFHLLNPKKRLDETATTHRARSIYLRDRQKDPTTAVLSFRSNLSVDVSQESTRVRAQSVSSDKPRPSIHSKQQHVATNRTMRSFMRSFTPAQEATHLQLESQCRRIDPAFEVKNYLSSEFPRRVQMQQNKISRLSASRVRDDIRMIHALKHEKRCIKSLNRPLYKPHDRIIRQLKRIYTNKQKGETELSTEANLQQESQKVIQMQESTKVIDIEERKQKWQRLKRQRVTMEDVEAVLKLYESGVIQTPRKQQEIRQQRQMEKLQQTVEQLKLKNSPISPLLKRFGALVEHFYSDFRVPMKSIIDFYQPQKIEDDNLESYETLRQDEQFSKQQNRIDLFFDRREQLSRAKPPRENKAKNLRTLFNSLYETLQETRTGIKQNIMMAEEARQKDIFAPVGQRFYKEIEVKGKLL